MFSRPIVAAHLLELIDNDGKELTATELKEALAGIETLRKLDKLEEEERQLYQKFSQISDTKMELKVSNPVDPKMDFNKDDVFYFACQHNHIDLITPLIEAKVSINGIVEEEKKYDDLGSRSYWGTKEEDIARKWARRKAYGEEDYEEKRGRVYKSPLLMVCHKGHSTILQKLFDAKASINSSVISRKALQNAAYSGHIDIVKLLMANKAPIADLTEALHCATSSNHLGIVELLLDNKVPIPEYGTVYGQEKNFLTVALKENVKKEIIYKLIERNAWFDNKIDEPLVYAAAQGYMEIVTKLLDAKASINHTQEISNDYKKRTALDAAAYFGQEEIVNTLLDKKAAINNNTLTQAAAIGNLSIVNRLLSAGANPNNDVETKDDEVKDSKDAKAASSAALVKAAENNHLDVVKRLLQANANANSLGEVSALSLACQNRNREMIKVLMDAKADVKLKYKDGHGSLYMLFKNKREYGSLSTEEYKKGLDIGILLLRHMNKLEADDDISTVYSVIFQLDPSDDDLFIFVYLVQQLLLRLPKNLDFGWGSRVPQKINRLEKYYDLLEKANEVGRLKSYEDLDQYRNVFDATGRSLPTGILKIILDYGHHVNRVIRGSEEKVYFSLSDSYFDRCITYGHEDELLIRFSEELSFFKPGNKNEEKEQKAVISTKQNP